MRRLKNILMLALVGVFVIPGASLIFPSGMDTMASKDYTGLGDDAVSDRYWCLYECRERYGINQMFGVGGGNPEVWRLYFKCVQDCERKFWKEWEKEMDKEK